MKFRSLTSKSFFRLGLLCLSLGMIFNSCSTIWDGEEDCPYGLILRFVYDYNMEYANAFHNKVDCITVFVYDEQGNHLSTFTETTSVLKDEGYRMYLDLEEGNYRLVAYGGMACDEHSFEMVDPVMSRSSAYTDRMVQMKEGEAGTRLHDFYYGAVDASVKNNKEYTETTLPMMKNTNNIRVILQQLNGDPLNVEDFKFSITDDNTLFSYDNSLIPNGITIYDPWDKGQISVGTAEQGDEEQEVVTVFAEFSTSRLVASNSPRLIVKRVDDDADVISIPLINYLMLLKSSQYSDMGKQEFLDRESEWNIIFFLDSGLRWINTHIVINDWVVRINHTEY